MKMNKAIITVVGKDRVGIIAGVCTYPVSYTHLSLARQASSEKETS